MVHSIIQLIEDKSDHETLPINTPTINVYIYTTAQMLNFDHALIGLREYANKFNDGHIPKHMDCIKQVGVKKILKTIQVHDDKVIVDNKGISNGGIQLWNNGAQKEINNSGLVDGNK